MAVFKGAGVALVTPMRDNGDVNFDKMQELVDWQIEEGTDAVIVCGTTGEASTLSHEEHLECVKACVDFAKKRVPVIAGTGSNSTETAIHLSREAVKRGADALLVVSPYYNKATQNGLKGHFTAIAKSVDAPIILYNIQGRTGVNIAPATTVSLVKEVDNIVGVKEASGDISGIARLMALSDGELELYSGNDNQTVPILSVGGIGVISVISNILPKETHDMVESYLSGDVKEGARLQLHYLPLMEALGLEVNPIPVKMALNKMGKNVGGLRMPLTEMEESTTAQLVAEMKKCGILA